eukprot:4988916-Pyramimonas_sp.AAC.1
MPSNAKHCHAIPAHAKQCNALPRNAEQRQATPNNANRCYTRSCKTNQCKSAGPLVGPPGCRSEVRSFLYQLQLPISTVTILLLAALLFLVDGPREGGEAQTGSFSTP